LPIGVFHATVESGHAFEGTDAGDIYRVILHNLYEPLPYPLDFAWGNFKETFLMVLFEMHCAGLQ
jgi:hypothetical protein